MGQPRRAEDRVRRLERIIDHIGRLYYTVGAQDGATDHEREVEETWKMIDREEDQTELEDRRAGSFGYRAQPPVPVSTPVGSSDLTRNIVERGPIKSLSVDPPASESSKQQPTRPRLKMRRTSSLLGNPYPSSSRSRV